MKQHLALLASLALSGPAVAQGTVRHDHDLSLAASSRGVPLAPCPPGSPSSASSGVVSGSGTPGTVPLWAGAGTTLVDSHIQDDGNTVSVSEPVYAVGGPDDHGLVGTTDDGSFPGSYSGVLGSGVRYGVVGLASATDVGWGVKGVASGTAVGVEGLSEFGAGIRGQALTCDVSSCTPTAGDAGQFVAGAGGILLHGFLANCNGPGCWDEKFRADADGSLTIRGNAYKPGGGSWSVLSDLRTKKSVTPIARALDRLLRLRGVTYEYLHPGAVGEVDGPHLGMVAQEVEAVFPSWVDVGPDGYKRVTFRGFEAVAVEALRDLQAEVGTRSDEAAERISGLKHDNAEIRARLDALVEVVNALQREAAARRSGASAPESASTARWADEP